MLMKHIKEQIRNIKVTMHGMESNDDLSEANRIILELGLELLEKLVKELKDELHTTKLLLKEKQRVLDVICMPHAIEWINEQLIVEKKDDMDTSKQNLITNLKIRKKQALKEFDAIRNLIRLYEMETMYEKRFLFLVKKAKDCLFSRREGHRGKRICGYSFVIRLFGQDITKC